MHVSKYFLTLVLWLVLQQLLFPQYYVKTNNDSINLESDSVLLYLDDYRGNVEWCISPGMGIPDWYYLERFNDTLPVRIEYPVYYMATVTEGTCTPVMSDTVFLGEKVTITGNNEFTFDSLGGVFLLPSGIKVKIPRGAVTGIKTIRIDTLSFQSANKLAFIRTEEYESFMYGFSLATDNFNFLKPIKIRIPIPELTECGLPVLSELNKENSKWEFSDETMIVDIRDLYGLNPFIEVVFKANNNDKSEGDGTKDLSLNDVRSFLLKLYGDVFFADDICRTMGYTVVTNDIDKSESSGCSVIAKNEDIIFWNCDPPQKSSFAMLEISPDCEPRVTGCPGNYRVKNGEKVPITLHTEIGGFPLSSQLIRLDFDGEVQVFPEESLTDSYGNATFDLIGDGKDPGKGFISVSVYFDYSIETIYSSDKGYTEYYEYGNKQDTVECSIEVTVFDLPEVVTINPRSILCTSAIVGGNVVDDNNDPVTERGLIFNGNKISAGNGTGEFIIPRSGLIPNSSYTVMAYATNQTGTSYGKQLSFMTLETDCVDVSSELVRDTACVCICEPYTVNTKVASEGGIFIIERGVYLGTTYNPELTGIKYESGSDTGSFVCQFYNLEDNTTYYVKGYALLSSGKQILGNRIIFSTDGKVTDIDGNVYNTTSIGDQVWMSENLRTSLYNDGSPILPASIELWSSLTVGTYFMNPPYGAWYNWYAVNTGKLCPTGWHVPTTGDVDTMFVFLVANGFNFDGTIDEYGSEKLAKALAAPPGWWHLTERMDMGDAEIGSPIRTDFPEKINSTCFSAVPGGALMYDMWRPVPIPWKSYDGIFKIQYVGGVGFYWTSSTNPSFPAAGLYYAITAWYNTVYRSGNLKEEGCSVRCVKDQ